MHTKTFQKSIMFASSHSGQEPRRERRECIVFQAMIFPLLTNFHFFVGLHVGILNKKHLLVLHGISGTEDISSLSTLFLRLALAPKVQEKNCIRNLKYVFGSLDHTMRTGRRRFELESSGGP